MAKTLYLIDGSGFIFRAYHALPPLTNPEGTPVGAVYGFVSMVMKLMEGNTCDYAAVIFDAARKTFRNRIYNEYKAHRPPPPDDLIPQFDLVRQATEALNLPSIEMADYEADDIIATYTTQARSQGIEVIIVSSDKDLMQLIQPGVTMYDAMKQKTIAEAEVKEKFGVSPDKVCDVLALMGDSSDNVPGVPGIGPKTAAELITIYGDLETLLERCAEIKQPKRRECLLLHNANAKLSKELVCLKHDVPGLVALDELICRPPAPEKLMTFVQSHGFKSLATRLQQKFSFKPVATVVKITEAAIIPVPRAAVEKRYTVVRDEKALEQWIEKARKKGFVAFDTETTSLASLRADLVGFSLSSEVGEACYVPLAHVIQSAPVQTNLFDETADAAAKKTLAPNQIPMERALGLIRPLLEDESVLKVGHNIKYDLQVMQRYGVEITPFEDTMLLSYVLHAGEHGAGMDELAERYLNYKTISYDEVTGTGRSRLRFDEVDIEKAGEYAAEDADITLRLYEFFKPQLFAERMLTLYETIERPLLSVLANMERRGIKVDPAQLAALSKDFAARMQEYEREVYRLVGHEFNIGSPKQLGEVLFDKMQLAGGRKSSKTGAYSTDNEVLEDLAGQGNEVAAKVIEWRQLAKLKSTYSDALSEEIDPKTGRVHTCFAQAIASTGRLSSSDPNLQNIPIRTEEGKKIRCTFVAEPGHKLLSADYSQIELRLLAHMASIEPLKEAFRNGDDIHAITASQMFAVPVDQINSDLRRSAKTINFGIIYGISAHGLATRLGISRSEAGAYIEQYFRQYPGIRDFMEESKEYARQHGYVTTLFGRRCHVPGIHDKNAARRQFYERAAINAPLQGTAADIIKRAMIVIDKQLPPEARMLLQVHDELVFEVKENAVEPVTSLVTTAMEGAAQVSVPLTVETGVGQHWGEAH
jgi:DNA polymerase I